MLHEVFMKRCLALAQNGSGTTTPNPLVGSVIVHQEIIIGEGWHYQSGLPHAEVNAIHSVQNPDLLRDSTLYVSLEPCAHTGKTLPCASLIIEKKIPRVVVACLDPNPQVAGKGVAMLREAGIEVVVGVLEAEATYLNRKFITFHTQKRPFVTLKWAQTADGYLAEQKSGGRFAPVHISGPESRVFVHKLRAEHDAIMIGALTALYDNPSLTTRHFVGNNPVRIVLDRENNLPDDLRIFTDGLPTWRFVSRGKSTEGTLRTIVLNHGSFLQSVLAYCAQNGVQSVLVEGGPTIHKALLQIGLWDEIVVLTAKMKLGSGLQTVFLPQMPDEETTLGQDRITFYRNHGLPAA